MRHYIGQPPFQWQGEINQESEQLRGLVGWWLTPLASKFDLALGNHATLTSDNRRTSSVVAAGLDLNGSSDIVTAPATAALNITKHVTLSTWLWLDSATASGKYPSLISKHDDYTGYGIIAYSTSGWRMQVGTGGVTQWKYTTEQALSANTLYHIAGVYDGAYLRFYINGQQRVANANTLDPLTATAGIVMGRHYSNGAYGWIDGWMADARIYNRALSAAEIWRLYDPQTRWELYATPEYRRWFVPVVAGTSIPVFQHSYRQRRA